ncbi:hypothetical protein QJS04_geneDACA001765 [Acorus gramineus]|uniref:PHD-type domain-containing protein n=1 Tax=Acorus gramineus TaxID=55184 RepID=A0AAV9BJH9_ACOGR|nr:hypothetical protein QJS04_geneDACA001765 [Acorus gramineus]
MRAKLPTRKRPRLSTAISPAGDDGRPRRALLGEDLRKKRLTSSSAAVLPSSASSPKVSLPDLTICHGCGSKNPRRRPRPLESHWRIVLLCEDCLKSVGSAKTCSYCLERISTEEKKKSLTCHVCSRRAHRRCLSRQCPFVVPPGTGDGPSFTCIDCWLPKRPRFYFEEVAAKERVGRKTVIAEILAVASRQQPAKVVGPAGINDGKLALLLHREINGSPRVSRKDVVCTENRVQFECEERQTSCSDRVEMGFDLFRLKYCRRKSMVKGEGGDRFQLKYYRRGPRLEAEAPDRFCLKYQRRRPRLEAEAPDRFRLKYQRRRAWVGAEGGMGNGTLSVCRSQNCSDGVQQSGLVTVDAVACSNGLSVHMQ